MAWVSKWAARVDATAERHVEKQVNCALCSAKLAY